MTGQAPQTLSELNNTPPPVPLPSLGGGQSLADVGALGQLNQFMAAGGANAIIERPQDPSTLTLDDLIDNRRRQTDAMLATHFREAAVADPKLAGEAQRLGLSLDPKLNPIDIERNVDGYRQLLAQKDAEQRAIAVQSPTLRRQLADPHFARIAFDRVDDLEFFDGLYKNYKAGRLTIEEGNLGDRFRRGIATNSDLANLQYIEKEMATLPARSGGPLDGLFRYVGQWSVTLPKALAVGAAAGTGAAILGQLGPQIGAPEEIISVPTAFTVGMLTETWASTARSEGGAMYLDMVRQGFDKNTAANVAGLAGIASGALEVVGLGVVGAPVKKALFGEVRRKVSELLLAPTMKRAGVEAAKGYLQGTLGEVGTEVLQTINEIIAKEVARPSGQKRVTFDEITTQVAETIVETAKGMAILGAVGPGIKLKADRRSVQRAQEQQRTIAQFLTRASELAPEAKARNPVAFEKSLQEMAKDSGAEVFYVDARTLGEMLRQQDKDQTQAGQGLTKSVASQIDEVVPGFSEQLAEAERTGGDVQIPSATFAARLGDTPLAAQMAPHMRLDPEDMSAAEAEKVAQEAEAQAAADEEIFAAIEKAKEQGLDAKQAIAKASSLNEQQAGEALIRYERQVAAREFQASLGRVREIIDQGEVVDGKRRAGLVEAAPSLPKVQRRAVGDAFEAAVAQLAENENISPEEAWRRYGPAIANQELTGDALQQFAGVQAKGVNKATMKKAWAMLAEGKSSAEIFSATGWSVSPEGTLRIELSDEAANLKGAVDGRLGGVLDHPALFKAYPQLADIPVSFTKVGAGIAGVYRPSRGISKWDASTASIRIADSLTDAMKLRTLLHEVQHAIQNIESEGTVQTRAQIAAASEVEARNVETRRKMTAAERAATPPEATEDVPRNLVLKRKDEFTMSDAEVAKAEQAAIEARTSIVEARKKPAAIEQAGQLNQPAPLKTDTPEFRAWFGESKVVDAEGKPLMMYHGTAFSGFTQFNTYATNHGLMGSGAYFTDNPEVASSYSDKGATRLRFGVIPVPVEGAAPGVYRVWLSIKKPLDMDATAKVGQWERAFKEVDFPESGTNEQMFRAAEEWYRDNEFSRDDAGIEIQERIKSMGYDGITHIGGGRVQADSVRHRVYIAFDEGQIKSPSNRGTFDPKDPNILRQPARGGFIRRALAILFGEKSDASTVVHELTHWYTEIVDRLAQQGSPWAVQQMGVLLDRWKLTREQWDAMPDAERAKHYEDISYNAEEYFATGQAPTAALAHVFEKLRTFILGIYKNIRGSLNAAYRQEFGVDLPAMTPELRGFFDRMLAGKEAVEQAAAERQLSPLFLDEKARKAAGITDEQWAEVQRLDAEARDAAVADLTAKAVRSMGVFEGARMRVVRELQSKLADTRAKVKAEVEKEVGSRPVYAAMQAIRYGEVIDENGQPQSAKLDTDAVRRILGDDADKLPHSLTRKGGVSPDAMAEQFGMGTGEAMLREMVAAPPMEDAVTQRTDERMQAEHSDLTDPKKLRRAIEEALHTSARGKLIATELRHLLNETRSTAALIGAAKEAARRILLRTAVGKISPRAFVAAEARAAKQAREALASGDVQEAIEAQRRYLLQHELTRQSLAIVAEVDKFVEAADSRYFADDEKVVRGRNLDIVQAARSILGEYGLASGRRYEKALRYLEVLRVENPELHAELVALVSDVSAEAQDYRSTPLEQFRVMVNAVESLWDRAKRANEIDVNGKRMARAEVKEQLLATSQRRYGEKPKPVDPKTIRARVAAASSGIGALLKRVEHWAEWVDGGTGAWTNYVVRPMLKRFDDYMASREQRVKVLRDIIKGLDLRNEAIDASQFLGDGVSFKNTAELLGAMLHMGNASNLQKLLGGYRWAAQNAEGEFDTAGWWRFVSHAIETGRITKSHLDALQQMWDLMEDMKHEAQKVNRDLYGTYFEEIKAQPFETPFGRYRGGYAPATPDKTRAENADLGTREGLDAIQDAERNFRESMPSAGRGFTKTRNASTRPLALDVRLVTKHVDEVLRFVHLQPSLRDVASLLRDRELSGYLNAVDPTLINSVLVPWLERTAANRTAQKGKSAFLDGIFAWMRRAVGLATMSGNDVNAAQNVTGITNALVYVERRHLVGAMWTGWTRDSAKEAAHLSKFMDQRLNSQIGQLQDDIDLALDPSAWGRLKDWTNRNGYFLQRMVQNRLDPIVWWGAFNQSMEKAGATRDDAAAVQQAVDDADAAVRKSQGGQRAIDVAAYEAGTPFARLFTQYSGYFNTVLNQISSQRGASAKAVAAVHALIFPTFVAGVIAAALNGRDDIEDKDGDGYSDEYMAWFFGQQIRGAAGLVPGFGPNALKALSAWGAVPGSANPGNRLALAPAFSMAETAIRAVGDLPKVLSGQAKAGQVRDFFSVLSLSGLPLAPVGRGLSTFMDEGR